jgi:hypothetical protein
MSFKLNKISTTLLLYFLAHFLQNKNKKLMNTYAYAKKPMQSKKRPMQRGGSS